MDARTILQELAQQVRRDTIQLLRAAGPAELTYAPPGTSNHILWHSGHALWLQDVLCVEWLAGRRELPPEWDAMFGMNCRPVRQTTDWPSREKIVEMLLQQLSRILELLESTANEALAKPADLRRGPATVAERILHGFHDEAKHSGEMYLLLKMQRTPAGE